MNITNQKKIKIVSTLLIAAVFMAGTAVLINGCTTTENVKKTLKTSSVQFAKGTDIEIAFSSIKQGKQSQFLTDYLPKVLPIVQKYGGRGLGAMAVIDVPEGEIKSQMVGFFEWPDAKTFLNIAKDQRVQELLKIRNDALSYINEANFFTVDTDVKVNFQSDRMYLICSIWANETNNLSENMKVKPLVEFKPSKDTIGNYAPSIVQIYDMHDIGLKGNENVEQLKQSLFKDSKKTGDKLHLVKAAFIFN